MSGRGDDVDEDDFIILEPKEISGKWDTVMERVFGDITHTSAAKQLAIGGAGGWVSGYLANKVGKAAAVSLAGTILVVQIAQYNGYISVDWTKVQRAMDRAKARAHRAVLHKKDSAVAKLQTFYEENFFLASGFTAGFLIGFFV